MELPLLEVQPDTKPLLIRTRGISSESVREHIHALPRTHPEAKRCLSLDTTHWLHLRKIPSLSLSAPHKLRGLLPFTVIDQRSIEAQAYKYLAAFVSGFSSL